MTNSSGFPDRKTVERIRKMYPEGCRVGLISMDDPYTQLKPGDTGTVRFTDDAGTVFVNWDSDSVLGIVYGVDHIERI